MRRRVFFKLSELQLEKGNILLQLVRTRASDKPNDALTIACDNILTPLKLPHPDDWLVTVTGVGATPSLATRGFWYAILIRQPGTYRRLIGSGKNNASSICVSEASCAFIDKDVLLIGA